MIELILLGLFSTSSQDFFAENRAFSFAQDLEILAPVPVPQKDPVRQSPKFIENPKLAALSVDVKTGKELFAQHPDRKQPIASLTKLVTALLILENHNLDDIVTVDIAATQAQGSRIDIYEYERLTIKTLLEAILIPSANDAAIALAVHHAGSEAGFVKAMNDWVKRKDIHSAHFYNATGLDFILKDETLEDLEEPTILGNQMSTRDVLKLARLSLENDFIRQTVQEKHFFGTSVDEEFFHEKKSTNQLLGTFLNLKGLKTGYTLLAGQCFIALGETPQGHEVLTVVLGSLDRFGETKNLLSWIYDSYQWR